MSLEGRIFENDLLRDAMKVARIGLCVFDQVGRVVVLAGDAVFDDELLISPVAGEAGNVVQFIGLHREVGERRAPSSNRIGAA